jgi:hypothetical protein
MGLTAGSRDVRNVNEFEANEIGAGKTSGKEH